MAGTLSYDHSKGGKATNFYIRQWDNSGNETTLQMFTNKANAGDKAVYYNIKFANKWKIYDSSSNTYYGYDEIDSSDPLLSDCGYDGDRNITISNLTGYYDVYLTSSDKIWIVGHSETTISDEMGNKTGYYIFGTPSDSSSALNGHTEIADGIPMYVNAAANTTDLAFYAGLRLSQGDVFYLASGETTNAYTAKTNEGNLLDNPTYFSFDGETGAITCNCVGYYCVALTGESKIHVTAWDGMEVDGTTRYTIRDQGGNPLSRRPSSLTPKMAPTYDNTKLNFVRFECTSDPANAYWSIHLWGGAKETTWPGIKFGGGSSKFTSEYIDASDYVGWTNYIIVRWSNSSYSGEWGRYEGSCSANTVNFWKTNGTFGVATPSTEKFAVVKEYKVLNGSPEGAAAGTGYCWNGEGYTPTLGATPSKSGYVFKGWYTNSACTASWSSGSAIQKDRNLYAKFVSARTVSFSGYKMDTSTTTANAKPSQSVENGSTFTFPAMPTPPAGYKLYDGKWHINTGSSSTSYAPGATSPAVTGNITYYVLYEKLPTCTINYYKSYDGVAGASIATGITAYQTASYTTRSLPSAETGYTLVGWYTSPSGTGTQYSASSTITVPDQSTLNLYACFTSKSYNYYITGSAKGNWGTGSGSIRQSATYQAGSVSWSGVEFARGETWKIYRPAYSEFNSGDETWWNYNTLAGATNYFQLENENYKNIQAIFAGTFDITLNLSNNTITVTLVTLNPDNFTLYQYDSSTQNQTTVNATRVSNSVFTFTVSSFLAGYYWHIVGPNSNYIWGYSGSDNITATPDYTAWFADSGHGLGQNQPTDIKNLYSMSCTVTFDFGANTILVESMSLVNNQFQLKTASSTIATQNASSYDGTVTFSNIHLATDTPWYLHVAGVYKYSFNAINDNVTMLGQSKEKGTYFYIADDGADYIGTGYGGTYTVVFNVKTHRMAITCTELDSTDFVAVRGIGSSGTTLAGQTPNLSAHTKSYTGSTHLFIGETLYFKNDNSGSSSSGSCIHNYYFNGDIRNYNLGSTNLVYVSGQYLYSRVDVTINYTFTFLATSANTTKADFTITSITENTDISFKHAEDAGIYLERASNSSFTSNVTRVMMHTTSGKDSGGNTYLAQEAPIYTSAGTSYMRIVKTHSNNSSTVPTTEAAIKEATEYYYVAQDTPYSGFASSTSSSSPTGSGSGSCITVTTAGTWTISLRANGQVHVEVYSGAATVSTEHNVPYYLMGRGMPGSGIRNCDYTIGKAISLYTYGGNSSTVPCYVGAYGTNTDPSQCTGTGIALKKGDTFALGNSANLIKTFASNSVTGLSINTTTGIVTVNTSATYQIYLTGSVGSETINIVKGASGSDWSRSDDVVARNGINAISSNGNTLTIGGNLDYSLLDAYSTNGYTFEVELSHVSTGAAGTVSYSITNGNAYAISVAKKDGNRASGTSYSANSALAAGGTHSSYSRTITASTTTATCIRITLSPEQIRAMMASGTYSFSLTISCTFTEGSIS